VKRVNARELAGVGGVDMWREGSRAIRLHQ